MRSLPRAEFGPSREIVALLLGLAALPASAAVSSVTGGDALVGNRSANLVNNGSFETGWAPVGGGPASWIRTSTGSLYSPVIAPPAWTTSGGQFTYAVWGNDTSLSSPTGVAFSAPFPHGSVGVYMGNSVTAVAPMPTFAADGVASFSGAPVFTHNEPANYGPAFRIEQTVTGLNTSATYLLDFWVSGEGAGTTSQANDVGIVEVDISGESPIFVGAPYGSGGLGTSQRYYVEFVPSSSSVTIGFVNYGHLDLGGGNITTEAVIDDIILNIRDAEVVPEPATVLAGAALVLLGGRRWASRRSGR